MVNRLNKWLDARGIQTFAFWDESDEERERPPYWKFWRTLPPRGTIGILFGSWYTRPIIARVFDEIDPMFLERAFEESNVKTEWYSKKVMRKRLKVPASCKVAPGAFVYLVLMLRCDDDCTE